jgi:hypothetical protein
MCKRLEVGQVETTKKKVVEIVILIKACIEGGENCNFLASYHVLFVESTRKMCLTFIEEEAK